MWKRVSRHVEVHCNPGVRHVCVPDAGTGTWYLGYNPTFWAEGNAPWHFESHWHTGLLYSVFITCVQPLFPPSLLMLLFHVIWWMCGGCACAQNGLTFHSDHGLFSWYLEWEDPCWIIWEMSNHVLICVIVFPSLFIQAKLSSLKYSKHWDGILWYSWIKNSTFPVKLRSGNQESTELKDPRTEGSQVQWSSC